MVKVIAEIGINHNGQVELAEQLIREAAAAGADFVKLQRRTPRICVPLAERDQLRDTPWGRITYLEYKERMEFAPRVLARLEQYASTQGVPLFYSVWDITALRSIEGHSTIIKIPSAKITDLELVATAASVTEHLIFSTGMSTADEIDQAWNEARQYLEPDQLTIMHCHSAYPAPSAELNLRFIQTLKRWYPSSQIGYSGHEFGIEPTVWAVILGAQVIERHITLDRTMWGTDQMASVEPLAFERMVRHIRSAEVALGTGVKKVWDSELPALTKLRG